MPGILTPEDISAVADAVVAKLQTVQAAAPATPAQKATTITYNQDTGMYYVGAIAFPPQADGSFYGKAPPVTPIVDYPFGFHLAADGVTKVRNAYVGDTGI